MKKTSSLCFLTIVSCFVSSFAQMAPQASWVVNPHEKKFFIENQGQFNGKNEKPGSVIQYGVDNLGTQIYFTSRGLTFRFDQVKQDLAKNKEWEKEEEAFHAKLEKLNRQFKKTGDSSYLQAIEKAIVKEKAREDQHALKTERILLDMEWVNANPAVQLTVEEQAPEYFNYTNEEVPMEKSLYYVKAYKKLIYKELYPGIDVEYVFHEKEGIKYNLILQPGADPSQIQMRYTGAGKLFTDPAGNVHIVTPKGDIIDHAPKVFYSSAGKNANLISSSFKLNQHTVSFKLGDYDRSQKVIIDPWTVVPATLTPDLKAYEIAQDGAGNVYVYGGYLPFKVQRYTSAGVAEWTFTAYSDTQFGDMAVDFAGNVYITSSAHFSKISPAGVLIWDRSGDLEPWRLIFNCDQSKLFRINGASGRICVINTSTGANAPYVNASPSEIRSITADPNCSLFGITAGTGTSNLFVSVKTSDVTVKYNVSSGHVFNYYGPAYSPESWAGFNAVAAGLEDTYIFDGTIIDKRVKATGASAVTAVVPGGIFEGNSGVAVDSCKNVYAGSQSAIYKYDENLVQAGLPANTPGPVYDLIIAQNGEVLACGAGFVGSFAMGGCAPYQCNSLTLAVSSTPASCSSKNGTATVTPSGSLGPYTYKWNSVPVQTTQTATNLGAGIYTVTVTDADGCINKATIKVDNASGLLVALKDTVEIKCAGDQNGSVTVTASGGTPPYTYAWNTTPAQTTATATGLGAGTYTVTVKDVNNCSSIAAITFTNPAPLDAFIGNSSDVSCAGGSDGTAQVAVTGGVTPYSYLWSTTPPQTTGTATNLPAGTYTVTITDANNCSAQTAITINDGAVLDISIASQNVSCNSGNDGSATVNVNSGGPYTYSWNTTPAQTTATATNLAANTYTVSITDTNGCVSNQTVVISEPSAIQTTITKSDVSCYGAGDGTAEVTVNGGTPSYTYSWNTTPPQTTAIATNLIPGTYEVTVMDANNCEQRDQVVITEPVPFMLNVNLADTTIKEGEPVSIQAIVTGGSGSFSYTWNPAIGNGPGPHVVNPVITTDYSVTVQDNNTPSCPTQTENVRITIETSFYFHVPNAFTPNGDGNNDQFLGIGEGIVEYNMSIFNRWGERIFESNRLDEGWNGGAKNNNASVKAPSGVYIYVIKLTNIYGKPYTYTGAVSLTE